MISADDLPIIEYVKSNSPYSSRKSYYGLNTSSNADLEPIDQLDGFLIAKYIQELFGKEEQFYSYIAGAYNALNARSSKEAEKIALRRSDLDRTKKKLLENVMINLELDGFVLTTYDLWNDEAYWEEVCRLVDDGIMQEMPEELRTKGIQMKYFPKEVLGAMNNVIGKRLDQIYSGFLYLPAEVAEAVWLKEKYGVEWKIGPPTEELYDRFIEREGIGIIRTTQPKVIESNKVVDALPYIGKTTQPRRILFSDNRKTLSQKCWSGNPSFERALTLAEMYGLFSRQGSSDPIERIYRLISLGKNSGD